jgi:acyl-coenzyme A synthetase/AMP-(fatty) acid ligase
VVTVPHPTSGTEPIAVIDSFANANVEQVKQHIRVTLGEYYAVREIICLKQLGLVRFPVNATHKIVKSEVQDAVLEYLKRIPMRESHED